MSIGLNVVLLFWQTLLSKMIPACVFYDLPTSVHDRNSQLTLCIVLSCRSECVGLGQLYSTCNRLFAPQEVEKDSFMNRSTDGFSVFIQFK